MRRSQRLIAAAVVIALSGALAGCGGGGMSNFDPIRSARLPRHQEEAAGRTQAGVPRRRAGPRAGRAEGSVQGLAPGADRPAERRRAAAAAAPPPEEPKSKRPRNPEAASSRQPQRRAGASLPLPPIPMPRRRKRAAPPRRRRRRSRRRSCAAAPPRRRPISRPAAIGAARAVHAAIRLAVPGADAERQLLALNFVSPFALTRAVLNRAHWIVHVLHDCHHRPAQCRKIDAVQPAGRAEARAGR